MKRVILLFALAFGTNATVMPAVGAKPVAAIFAGRPIGDASIARLPSNWYTMFGNDPTAPWRMHFGLIPVDIGPATSIDIPRAGEVAKSN